MCQWQCLRLGNSYCNCQNSLADSLTCRFRIHPQTRRLHLQRCRYHLNTMQQCRYCPEEVRAGLRERHVYESFQPRIERIRDEFLAFLRDRHAAGAKVVGYGAAAKGNTLLNYSEIKGSELIRFVADLSPHKQGRFLPGSHIPVVAPEQIDRSDPLMAIALEVWNRGTVDLGVLPPAVADAFARGWLRPPVDGELLARARAETVKLRETLRARNRQNAPPAPPAQQ